MSQSKPRILVVEDERIVALDLKLNLESLGYEVSGVAASEDDALRGVAQQRPDLVLMDINLGRGGDGIRAAAAILRDYQAPVVYLTAYAEPETLRRAGESAPYGYLLKPIELRELNATVRMALARHAAEGRLARTERRLRLALDAARMGVLELQPGSLAPEPGHELAERRGFRLTPQDFLEGLQPETREQARQRLLPPGAELHLVTRWGAGGPLPLWLEIQATHLAGEGVIVGLFRDVSEQVRNEGLLRQAAVVFESAADAILILDEQGRVLSANPAFRQLTGFEAADLRGRRPEDFLQARRAGDRLSADPAEGQIEHAEAVCRRRDGGLFPIWEHRAPVRDAQGRLTHQVLSFSDISALRQAEGRVRHLAFHDPLTGLGNRHHLDDCLRLWTQRESAGFGLLFIDLDGFKAINDSLGHAAGDQLLRGVAERLRQSLRAEDEAIRLGGDEFVVLARGARPETLALLAGKLLESLRLPLRLDVGEPVRISASIGIAQFPLHAEDGAALLRAADGAMYAAKARGRDGYAFYSPELGAQAHSRLQIEQGLRAALEAGELALHWQPQVELETGRPIGVEALLRWPSRSLGEQAPRRLVAVAEEAGLSAEIGQWVLRAVLAQWQRWRAQRLDPGRVALNLAPAQLRERGFAAALGALLQEYALPAAGLELEVTEATLAALDDPLARLGELQALGVRLVLDDFGSGPGSLLQLRRLPLQGLRLDRGFVVALDQDARAEAWLGAILGLGRTLDLELLAEGVETEAQCQALRRLGLRQGQGWLFARALPRAEFEAWWRGRMR